MTLQLRLHLDPCYGVQREQDVLAAEKAAERMGYMLKDKQREVILSFVRGHDVFVSLPTGSGKSLCYSCLLWTFDYLKGDEWRAARLIVVVVSSLIALMKDQVAALPGESG